MYVVRGCLLPPRRLDRMTAASSHWVRGDSARVIQRLTGELFSFMLIEGTYTELYWQLTCPSRCSLWFSTSVKTEAVILLHLYLYAWLLRTLWNTVGPGNRCRWGAGVRKGGQMPHRWPNQVSGRSVSHPMEDFVLHKVTGSKGGGPENK